MEDWANVVTNVSMVNTPCLAWLPMGKKPVQAERSYQAEAYKDAAVNSHADGVTVQGATSAGDQRVSLRSVIQYSTKAASVTKLTQDYGNNAAVQDELGKEITKQTKELSNDIESALLSSQDCRVGVSGTTGFMSRGIGSWIATGAQTTYPVDSTQRPATAQVDTTATGSLTEDVVLNILQSIGSTTESNETVTCFAGPTFRRAFNNFPMFTPATASTVNSGAYPNPVRGAAFDRGINRYITPFGFEVDLVTSWRNHRWDVNLAAIASTSTLRTHGSYFLHQSKWEFAWGEGGKPNWVQKPYEGGKYEAFAESIWMLTCWTPKGEAKWAPAT